MSDQEDLHILPVGYELQEYEIRKMLGEGGFGVTYLAFDRYLDTEVAIKEYLPTDFSVRQSGSVVIARSSASQKDFDWGLERFLDEAKTLAKFRHPNIVRVTRFFQANGTAYIVMEYVEGNNLEVYLDENPDLDEVAYKNILEPILGGLRLVHNAEYLHRDISPDNIRVQSDGTPVLIDFGAARLAIGVKSKPISAIVKPGYAPLEQYSNNTQQGPYTDIYALAAVSYQAITGEMPPEATERLATKHDTLEPLTDQSGLTGWSRSFLEAVNAGLELRSADRPQNLDDWQRMFTDGAAERKQDTSPASPSYEKKPADKSELEEIPAAVSTVPAKKKSPLRALLIIVSVFSLVSYVVYKIDEQRKLELYLEELAIAEQREIEDAAEEQARIDQEAADQQVRDDAAAEQERLEREAAEQARVEQEAANQRAREAAAAADQEIEYTNGVYVGQVNADGRQHGKGTYTYTNGDKYIGDYLEGNRTGYGRYEFENGDFYEGEFNNNFRSGYGRYVFPDGNSYEGEFEEHYFNGLGIYRYVGGNIYSGHWKDGKRHGKGALIYESGNIDFGDWVEGSYQEGSNSGTNITELNYESGDSYFGEIDNNRIREGYGVYKFSSGTIYTGYFKGGEYHGYGFVKNIDGSSYAGYWSENNAHGTGVYITTDGSILRGQWANGSFQSSIER